MVIFGRDGGVSSSGLFFIRVYLPNSRQRVRECRPACWVCEGSHAGPAPARHSLFFVFILLISSFLLMTWLLTVYQLYDKLFFGGDFMALAKLYCNIEEDLLKQVDDYASILHITRTAAVSVLLSRALQAEKLTDTLSDLMDAYKSEKAAIGIENKEI